jgi:uncharacterized protein YjbI with pentapeptide repeats
MKASEVLKRYDNGERNFSEISLRGESFKGCDLSGVNFSQTDIRGTDFTNAYLRKANFSDAQAGLQRRWVVILLIGSTFLLSLSGFPLAITGWWLPYFFIPKTIQEVSLFPGVFIAVILIVLIRLIIVKGENALALVGAIGGATVAVTAFTASVGASKIAVAIAIAGATATVGAVAALVGASAISGALVIAKIAGATGVVIASALVTGFVSGLAAAAVDKTGGASTAVAMEVAGAGNLAIIMAGLGGVASIILSALISWLARIDSDKYTLVCKIANALASIHGTSFRNADLTDVNFTGARLKSTDLRRATLVRACWRLVKELNCSRLGDSFLQNPEVRQLVVTGKGEGKNFAHLLNLEGINLIGANLKRANFEGSILQRGVLEYADLTEANLTGVNLISASLKNADLFEAQLIRTRLGNADLSETCLTGACIEDWNITTQTRLDYIKCKYVFMSSSRENPRRQPDNWDTEFKEGEFSEFIAPIIQTLNLYHNQLTINSSALAISFNELCIKNPDAELEIASIEKRGKNRNKFLLRVFTSEQADLSKLHSEYFSRYDELQSLSSETLRSLLIQSERGIQLLARMVERIANRPINYINYVKFLEGVNVSDNSVNIQGNTGINVGNIATGGSVVNLGAISGNVTTTINQLPTSSELGEPNLKELLLQLQSAIEEESGLSDEDKAMALEQVQALAEAGQDPKQGAMQKVAKAASTMLRGIVAGLPDAAKLVEACSKLLPIILSLFGL